MHSASTGSFLVYEAALVLGSLGLRAICAHRVPIEDIPRTLRRRVDIRNRVAPGLAVLAGLALVVGLVLWANPF